LREQINEAYPNRDKGSDGTVGDLRHSRSKSDHNPNAKGVVTAIDIDEDIAPGATVAGIVSALQASRDARIKYLIYEGRITEKGDIRRWKRYNGANSHSHHVHISVSADPNLYDDASDWDLDGTLVAEPVKPKHTFKRGDKGEGVKVVQDALFHRGYKVDVDGDFGPGTEKAVKVFQATKGLRPDGIAGPNTLRELGL
jgi:murein L,D-transpeptidase YcbB/YkuD